MGVQVPPRAFPLFLFFCPSSLSITCGTGPFRKIRIMIKSRSRKAKIDLDPIGLFLLMILILLLIPSERLGL
jgi:hypothetical protein